MAKPLAPLRVNGLDIIVCFKQVLDPDIPARDFKVDEDAKCVVPPPNVSPVISNFDEYAIEAAVQLGRQEGAKLLGRVRGSVARDPNRPRGAALPMESEIGGLPCTTYRSFGQRVSEDPRKQRKKRSGGA